MSGAESPKVHKEAVPRPIFLVAVLESFKGQKGGAPRKCVYYFFVFFKDVERYATISLCNKGLENSSRIVSRDVPINYQTGGFEQLKWLTIWKELPSLGGSRISRLAVSTYSCLLPKSSLASSQHTRILCH